MGLEPNWGLIRSGATFESLVCTLVQFEDPQAILFGRAGKDYGQDARSGDQKTIFQAKYHQSESATSVISDAKKEATKVAGYIHSGGKGATLWNGVKSWVLVTNATFNPNQDERWRHEIVPEFEKLGITASYWEQADLNTRLANNPEVYRAYFESESRVFLTPAEARDSISALDFFPASLNATLRGRADELADFSQFLDGDKRILLLHGPGGVGKTRLLLEAGEQVAQPQDWQVLWANVDTLATSSSWFSTIVPERRTLVLVDEPDQADVLKSLVEQIAISHGRASQWKVAIAARSPKDPVLSYLAGARLARLVQIQEVRQPVVEAATAFCRELLDGREFSERSSDWKEQTAIRVAILCDQFPVWISIAVRLLARRDDLSKLPQTTDGLAAEYLTEVYEEQQDFPPKQLKSVVRWVSLLNPLNREDEDLLTTLAGDLSLPDSSELKRRLIRLTERRLIFARGARARLLEVKPDVLRDHIVREWLTLKSDGSRELAGDGRSLIAGVVNAVETSADCGDHQKAILRSIARLDFTLRASNEAVPLLDELFDRVQDGMKTWTVEQKLAGLEAVETVAPVRVLDTVAVVKAALTTKTPDQEVQGLFGTRLLAHRDVVLRLAWILFEAALYATSEEEAGEIIRLLYRLAEEERQWAGTKGLPNDGKRATDLVPRTISGGPDFRVSYARAAFKLIKSVLENLTKTPAGTGLILFLEPLLAVERRHMETEEAKMTIHTYLISPKSNAWQMRSDLIDLITTLLAKGALGKQNSEILWKALDFAQGSATRARSGYTDSNDTKVVRQDLIDILKKCAQILRGRELEIWELKAARQTWNWHLEHGKDEALKTAALECERVFRTTTDFDELEPFVSWSRDRAEKSQQKAAELAASAEPNAIAHFVQRAMLFLDGLDNIHQLSGVAYNLGSQHYCSPKVRSYVQAALNQAEDTADFLFALPIADGWLETARSAAPEDTPELLKQFIQWCQEDEKICRLVSTLYQPPMGLSISQSEVEVIRQQEERFRGNGGAVRFLRILAATSPADWEGFKPIAEAALTDLSPEDLLPGVGTLLDTLYLTARDNESVPREDLSAWTLAQLSRIDDMDNLGGNLWWELRDFVERTERPNIAWLNQVIDERLARKGEDPTFKVLPAHERLSTLVRAIPQQGDISEEDIVAIRQLLAHTEAGGMLGYVLPEYIADVDPAGRVSPDCVVEHLKNQDIQGNTTRIWAWSRLAGVYPKESEAWRRIAGAACSAAESLEEQERRSIWNALEDPRPHTYSGAVGELHPRFEAAAERAKKALKDEENPRLLPYRRWHLRCAEAELEHENERLKEERGE